MKPKKQDSRLLPIPGPVAEKPVRADQVFPGRSVPPIVRVKMFSASEWEDFIGEWVHSLKSKYHFVLRCAGAGDMGRDIVAHIGPISSGQPWDNFQCKHYDHPLAPGDIWVELGKLVYYTFLDEFTLPRAYYFISPQDVGTSLARLLERPSKLKAGLITNWEKKCRYGICGTDVKLEGELKDYVDSFPFKIISTTPVLKIIEEHRRTPWYVQRFGGGLPDRPDSRTPPDDIEPEEIPYVSELFRAYSEHQGKSVQQATLKKFPDLEQHFRLTRNSFFSAESLKAFSRDHLPENEFGRLQDEVRDGVQETYVSNHVDGFHKVRAVTKAAIDLQITDHALIPVLKPSDRRGICHQIVNVGHFAWVESNGKG
jgi:hypothetical protein